MNISSSQYFVRAPFVSTTAIVNQGMEVIPLRHCWGNLKAQVVLIVTYSSSTLMGLVLPLQYPRTFSPGVWVRPVCRSNHTLPPDSRSWFPVCPQPQVRPGPLLLPLVDSRTVTVVSSGVWWPSKLWLLPSTLCESSCTGFVFLELLKGMDRNAINRQCSEPVNVKMSRVSTAQKTISTSCTLIRA